MRIFFDSSALVKRYILEQGTERVNLLCAEADEVILSVIAIPEIISAFNRLLREKKIGKRVYNGIKNDFIADVGGAVLMNINETILKESIICLEKGAIRTLDALQVAAAKDSLCQLFVSADIRQCEMAKKMNLKVERL